MTRWQRLWLVCFIFAVSWMVIINATHTPPPAAMIAAVLTGLFGSAFVRARNPEQQ